MLKKFFKQFKYGQKGFTLIELLVVIAILGVLAAVAIPNVSKFIGKGKVEAANTEFATVQTAVAAYQADGGVVAASSDISGMVSPYIQNPLMYTYSLALSSGSITIAGVEDAKSTAAGITWDTTNKKWK
jgi:type IV pilus assembly protein PilA